MKAAGPRTQRRRAQRAQQKGYRPHAAALGLIVVALLVSSMYPARQLVAKRHRVAALKSESAALDRQIADMRAHRDALQTDEEVERIAREELGMIRPGETAFALVPRPQPATQQHKRAEPHSVPAPSAFDRWWSVVSRAFRVPR